MNLLKKLIYLMVFVTATSCVSLNANQTGRTLGSDNSNVYGSFSFGKLDRPYYIDFSNVGEYYIGEIGFTHGIKENFDLGVSVNSSLHLTGKSKYQYLGNRNSTFASSLGLNLGVGPLGLVSGAMSYSSSFAIYNSIHIREQIAITLNPQYIFFGFSNLSERFRFDEYHHIYGYSSGLVIGEKHQFIAEYSQYVNQKEFNFQSAPQFSIGYIVNF